ncbi:exodeoxyribonuclease VII large subunit, partial [Propylenella binzhouense]
MAGSPSNIAEYTVSELAFALKRTVEDAYEQVRVRGEISGFRGAAGSGHCYFTLKDDRACLDAVVWKTTFQRLRFKPQEGLEMVASGKLTTYPGRSRYQIVVESLEPAGQGALMVLLEERRKRLESEGLFAEARKRPLPFLPSVVGVVTSPTGAVIRDILHRLRDRCPCRVLVWPVRVQGEGAAEEVAAAIAGFNAIAPGGPVPRPDVLIVARGGGSIEDLWAFNEEVAVRAVAASRIPTIAAVGHETDWTLVDFAADLRAPTPTGAAEKAVPVRAELLAGVADLARRHHGSLRRLVDYRARELAAAAR